MKKVEIITLHYIDNYGSVLQSLATQEIFKKIGYTSEIIDIVRENHSYISQYAEAKNQYKKKLGPISLIMLPVIMYRWKRQYKKRHRVFSVFRDNYLHLTRKYTSSEDLKKDPPIGDIYCTGSDQVWNTTYNGGILDEYYLSFVPKGKIKIALSSSFGSKSISESNKETVQKLLLDYDQISVREESALTILQNLGIKKGIHVVDPTLALSSSEWDCLLQLKPIRKEKYVLVYQLNNNAEMISFAKKLAKQLNLELVMITKSIRAKLYCRNVYFCPTIIQFLSLIKNADYVVTDSFHGTAFSLNFNKEFYIFYPPHYNTRIQSLLNITHTLDRVVSVEQFDNYSLMPIDYDNVNAILKRERKKIMDFVSNLKNYT